MFLSSSGDGFEEFLFIPLLMILKSSAVAGLSGWVLLRFFKILTTFGSFKSVSSCTIGETDFCLVFSIVCG